MPNVDRLAPLPLYYQLKQLLLADMKRQQLKPGDRMPGDHELCQRFGVSRTVVRQALSDLEAAGVIERIKGRGTFVATPKTAEGLVQSLTGLFEDVAARGAELRSEVRQLETVPADDRLAQALQVELGSPVIALERLRFVDDKPWVLTMTHVPYDLAPGLLEEDMTRQSLYALMEGKYGVQLKSGRRTIEATIADAALARSLRIHRGAPVLVLNSISYGTTGRPVETFVAYHRGDRSRFEVTLTRHALSNVQPLMMVTS